MNLEIDNAIEEIIGAYLKTRIPEEDVSGDYEPLDGDEVDAVTEHIRNQLNLHQGNITMREYTLAEGIAEIEPAEENLIRCEACLEEIGSTADMNIPDFCEECRSQYISVGGKLQNK